MQTLKQIERLQKLHQLIAIEKTGSPCYLASTFSISRRSLFMMIEQLRDMKAEILYSRSRNTYYYNNDFQLQVSLSIKAITQGEAISIFGGNCVSINYLKKNKVFIPNYLC